MAVSLHEELKNATKIFSKIRPEDLKKMQSAKEVGGLVVGRYVASVFLFFFGAPWA
jgi:hypothetical protein